MRCVRLCGLEFVWWAAVDLAIPGELSANEICCRCSTINDSNSTAGDSPSSSMAPSVSGRPSSSPSNKPSFSIQPSASPFTIDGYEIDLAVSISTKYTHPSINIGDMWITDDGMNYDQNSGYASGIVSPRNVLFNWLGDPATMSCPNGSFDVRSMYMTPAWYDNIHVTVNGYDLGTLVVSVTLQLGLVVGPPKIVFESDLLAFKSIDYLAFTPTSIGLGYQFAMDDVENDFISECDMSAFEFIINGRSGYYPAEILAGLVKKL